jgi:hypothetical protein
MKNKQRTNWWIDLVLFISFITSFFFYLTGMTIHQWIGAFAILLAIFHFILHFKWVKSVGKRFFGKLSTSARLYYVLDFLLLTGFLFIGVSGLVISSWINLSLTDFDSLLSRHTVYPIFTLVIQLVKLVFHIPWIVRIGRKILVKPVGATAKQLAVQPIENTSGRTNRREFLIALGVVSAASLFALASASKDLIDLNSGNNLNIAAPADPQTPTAPASTSQSSASEQVGTEVEASASTITEEPAADQTTQTANVTAQDKSSNEVDQPTSVQSSSSEEDCTVRCPRGCAYPGHCRKYSDAYNDGY